MMRVTSRDIVRSYRSLQAPEAEELAAVMVSLVIIGWVIIGWLEPELPANPAKPVTAWAVNPAVHEIFQASAERERELRERAKEAIKADIEVLRGMRERNAA